MTDSVFATIMVDQQTFYVINDASRNKLIEIGHHDGYVSITFTGALIGDQNIARHTIYCFSTVEIVYAAK